MEVKDANAAMLSNYEVFALLTELRARRQEGARAKGGAGQQHLQTVLFEALRYLSGTPCRLQSAAAVRAFLGAVQPHRLTKAEALQLLNHRPRTAVEIQLMVEESEERLSEEQIEQLIRTASTLLPGPEEEEAAAEESMEGAQGGSS